MRTRGRRHPVLAMGSADSATACSNGVPTQRRLSASAGCPLHVRPPSGGWKPAEGFAAADDWRLDIGLPDGDFGIGGGGQHHPPQHLSGQRPIAIRQSSSRSTWTGDSPTWNEARDSGDRRHADIAKTLKFGYSRHISPRWGGQAIIGAWQRQPRALLVSHAPFLLGKRGSVWCVMSCGRSWSIAS